jgi:hypothetical protein
LYGIFGCLRYIVLKNIRAHYFVLQIEPTPGREIDHINGNKLDNRKTNLRVVTRAENARNIAPSKLNKTGVRGVWYRKDLGTYAVQTKINGKRYCIGSLFKTVEEAEAALVAFLERHDPCFGAVSQAQRWRTNECSALAKSG